MNTPSKYQSAYEAAKATEKELLTLLDTETNQLAIETLRLAQQENTKTMALIVDGGKITGEPVKQN
mgnify:CR=1 FL=1